MTKSVTVGGQSYPANEDDNGTLRFIPSPEHHLVKGLTPVFGGKGDKTPNDMAIAYHKGEVSLKDYAEMNIGMGYSIGGFEELSSFENLEILTGNPDWDRAGRKYTDEDERAKRVLLNPIT